MSDQLLTFLKYIFLALLYLFFLRVLRAVWVELREPRRVAVPPSLETATPGGPTPPPPAAAANGKGRRRRGTGEERLVIVEPTARRDEEYPLSADLTVGRAGGCGVILSDDSFVSQLHARVFRRDGGLFVEDLGSTNGTYLNKRKVTGPVPIRKGDKLQIGKAVLVVRQ